MKVIYKNQFGDKIYSEINDDIPGLMAILKEASTVKMGIDDYKVESYKLEYAQVNDKNKDMESELVVILKRNVG
ncbi:hypothetical protein CN581_14480 [Bacillus toyonensis]|uniref:hypothetical protein n=1 Tax=Bacillus toyonensis TaxID=155322 RepID=UPI000BF77F9D|nr:hypothetical protein [Bacillus toyonensis]PEP80698.1 hypothetical protein CN581_14480 [Bacillus toyonensis]